MNAKHPHLNSVVRRFIQDTGNITQSLGIGRVVGQIYAYLYFSREPRGLHDLQSALGISKGSASMGVRQLEQWSAVRKVWIKGDRKDYYEANDWFGRILKNAVIDTVGQRLESYASMLDQVQSELAGIEGDGEAEFVRERVDRLRAFQEKAQKAWNSPMMKILLR